MDKFFEFKPLAPMQRIVFFAGSFCIGWQLGNLMRWLFS